MADTSSDRNPVEKLGDEFVQRCRAGERPPLSEYTNRYPDLAEEIRELFPTLLMMEDVRPKPGEEPGVFGTEGPAAGTNLERLGDYRILREVGRGGMGVVYEAEEESLGRHVAVKVLPAPALLDPKQRQRFEREARAAARLHHTNIISVYGVGEQGGLHYYVMPFIQGLGLDEVLDELRRLRKPETPPPDPGAADDRRSSPVPLSGKEGGGTAGADLSAVEAAQALLSDEFPVNGAGVSHLSRVAHQKTDPQTAEPQTPPGHAEISSPTRPEHSELSGSSQSDQAYFRSAARVVLQVAEALDYAHRQGVLHRDIKPSNLLLDTRGTVWVMDFGLAKTDDSDDLTHTGDLVGTLRYMAPERFAGKSNAQSDIYSLGLTLYELATLRPAFDESQRELLMHQVTSTDPVRPRKLAPEIPRDLETIILKATDRQPQQRYSTAGQFAEDLQAFLDGKPIAARRVGIWERGVKWAKRRPAVAALTGTVVLVAAVGIGGVSWQWRKAAAARDRLTVALQGVAEAHTESENARVAAERAREQADRQARRARAETQKAQQVADFLARMFLGADPVGLSGYLVAAAPEHRPDMSAREMLDWGAENVAAEFQDEPLVQAQLMDTIGSVYLSLGLPEMADPLLRTALKLRQQHVEPPALQVAQSMTNLGALRLLQGDYDQAAELMGEALGMCQDLVEADDPEVVRIRFLLALIELERNESDEVLDELEKCLRLMLEEWEDRLAERDLAVGLAAISLIRHRRGETLMALQLIGEVQEMFPRLEAPIAGACDLTMRGVVQLHLGFPQQAATLMREGIHQARRAAGATHLPVQILQRELARLCEEKGELQLAEEFYRGTTRTAQEAFGRQPRTAAALQDLARILIQRNNPAEAETLLREALAIEQETLGPQHRRSIATRQFLNSLREPADPQSPQKSRR